MLGKSDSMNIAADRYYYRRKPQDSSNNLGFLSIISILSIQSTQIHDSDLTSARACRIISNMKSFELLVVRSGSKTNPTAQNILCYY